MASDSQAGYGLKPSNSENLIAKGKTMFKYSSIPDEIKIAIYELLIVSTILSITSNNKAQKIFKECENETNIVQNSLLGIVRIIRATLFEIYYLSPRNNSNTGSLKGALYKNGSLINESETSGPHVISTVYETFK